ncbi:MAG: DNA-processing protein DprA [Bacillota bacterium]
MEYCNNKAIVRYIKEDSPDYPSIIVKRLGNNAPERLSFIGNLSILSLPKTALFCSADTPGSVILPAYDKAAEFRDSGKCVLSGFHSPIEKECLKILLRGKQPIIICPARAIETMRLTDEFRKAIKTEHLLILSPFINSPKRITRESALRRNELVAALADEAFIAYVKPGSHTEDTIHHLKLWNVSFKLLGK